MNIFNGVTQFHIPERTVATFGKFDGIHMGHMALINTAARIAREQGLKLVVFTFDALPSFRLGMKDGTQLEIGKTRKKKFLKEWIIN